MHGPSIVKRTGWFAIGLVSVLVAGVAAGAPPVIAEAAGASEARERSAATGSVIPPAHAARQGEKLDALFEKLKAADTQEAGRKISSEIWAVWFNSGSVDVDALVKQAQLAIREGGVQEAYGALDRAIEIAPDYAEAWNRRATLNYMMGRHTESVRDIQKTLSLEPRHFGALSGLGLIYLAQKNWSAALNAYEKAVEVNPWLPNKDRILAQLRERVEGESL